MPKLIFKWDNFASVDMLSQKFNRSKRRIQQLLVLLKDKGELETIVGVYQDEMNPYAIPMYRRIEV